MACRGSGSSRHQAKAHQAAGRRMRVALVNPPWRFDGSIYFGCREPHLPFELGYAQALAAPGWPRDTADRLQPGTALRHRSLPGHRGLRRRDDGCHHGTDLSVLALRATRTACAAVVFPGAWPARRADRSGRPARVGHARWTLRKLDVDAVVRGECEHVVAALAKAGDWSTVPSIGSARLATPSTITGGPAAHDFVDLPPLRWPDELDRPSQPSPPSVRRPTARPRRRGRGIARLPLQL